MQLRFVRQVLAFFIACYAVAVCGADLNTPEEAKAMVKKAIAQYKAQGRSSTFADIDKLDGPYVDKEIFTFVLDKDGTVLAHGNFHKMIGVNIMEIRDKDGYSMVKEFVQLCNKGGGWAHYKFPNPITKVIEPKMTYVERFDGLIFAAGMHYSEKKQ